MHPVLLETEYLTIHWYGVLYALGFLAAAINWTWLARRRGWPASMGTDLGILIMVSSVVGARVAFILSNPEPFLREPARILQLHEGGLIYYGGLVLCCISGIVYARLKDIPLSVMADFIITSVPLGHAIGRIGCFLHGCCYGSAAKVAWAVSLGGILRHPTPLYEAALNFLLYGVLLWAYFRRKKDGLVFALYLILYPAGRLALEFVRGDERMKGLWLNVSQELSLIFILIGAGIWFALSRTQELKHGTPER